MATTSTDPREIEADLERERAALADTLDTLSDRVSVDHLAREALGVIRGRAGTATTSIDHAVRNNPVAAALIGAGIAWLFLGPRLQGSSDDHVPDTAYDTGTTTAYGTGTYGRRPAYGTYTGGDLRHDDAGWASSRSGAGSTEYGRVGYVPSDNDEDHAWAREAHGLRAKAVDALHRIESEAKSYYASFRDGLSSSGSSARDFAAERSAVVSSFTNDLRTRLSSGLNSLPESSRERIIAARERAYAAMLQAERTGRSVIRDPGHALEEHPLVAGAVAFALGAAIGAALPSTDVENRTFGAERDRLMDEAARMLRDERDRAQNLAGSLRDEVTSAARETAEAVADTVSDKASETAQRLSERTNEEFRDMQNGEPKTKRGPGDPVVG